MKLINISTRALYEAAKIAAIETGYHSDDLIKIIEAHYSDWDNPQTLDEATGSKQPASTNSAPVRFVVCELYKKTLDEKASAFPIIKKKVDEFLKFKYENPTSNYGSSDSAFVPGGPLANAVPGLRHAHISRDLSIFYTLSGNNPKNLRLYAIASHQDSGTGTPSNTKRQQSFGKRLQNQTFS